MSGPAARTIPPLFDTAARPPSYVLPKLLLAGYPSCSPSSSRGPGASIMPAEARTRAGSVTEGTGIPAPGHSDELMSLRFTSEAAVRGDASHHQLATIMAKAPISAAAELDPEIET